MPLIDPNMILYSSGAFFNWICEVHWIVGGSMLDSISVHPKPKKKALFLILIAVISVSSIVLVSAAYINGRAIMDSPKVQWVSHTEYWSGDKVSTIVRLTDYKGDPLDVDSCSVNIIYPNKSPWISNAQMYESSIPGNWYRTDTAQYIQGTYEQEVTCYYGGGKIIKSSQSFHVNPALTKIQNISSDIIAQTAQLTEVHADIVAQVAATNDTINTNIENGTLKVTDLVNTVNADLGNQIVDLGQDLDATLTDVNTTILASMGNTQVAIQDQMGAMELTLSDLTTSLNDELKLYLTMYLNDINTTATNIYSDVQWLTLNAMNQENAAAINARFDTIDSNLALIEDFCSNPETVNSELCQEVYMLRNVVDTMRQEQTDYYTELDTTTTSTWDLLSGSITSNVDVLLGRTEIIQAQTTEINETVTDMRRDQVETVHMQVIS